MSAALPVPRSDAVRPDRPHHGPHGRLLVEATRPSAADIAALGVLARGTRVYLSAVPNRPADESLAAAMQIRAAGLEPVPHVAVRNFASAAALDDFLARLNGEAGVETVLVIAGDRAEYGPFRARAGRHRQRHAAPARHPHVSASPAIRRAIQRIGNDELNRALADKIAAAEATGLAVEIVTQFCFDAGAILDFVARAARLRLRARRARRPCRTDEPHRADALCEPLRRARLGARTGAPLRPDAADVRPHHARRSHPHACRGGTGRRRSAFLFVRRHAGDRALGRAPSPTAASRSMPPAAFGLSRRKADERATPASIALRSAEWRRAANRRRERA